MKKIIVADDHAVFREGLRSLLAASNEWEVVAEASDGFELLPLIEKHMPDLIIIDLAMPNLGGIETISRLRKSRLSLQILVLSAKDDECSVGEAMKAGANGFLPKSSNSDELKFAIRAVLKNQTYVSPSVCGGLLGRSSGEDGDKGSPISSLSSREREVMKLLSEGRPNRDVAKMLHISPRTVDSHRANIMKKLGISSNAELVQLALKYGLVE